MFVFKIILVLSTAFILNPIKIISGSPLDYFRLANGNLLGYFKYMRNTINVSGQKIRKAVMKSGFTKEQVVASVQDAGYRFSLAGLDKMYRDEFPVRDSEEIVGAIALKCGCLVSDLGGSEEIKTA